MMTRMPRWLHYALAPLMQGLVMAARFALARYAGDSPGMILFLAPGIPTAYTGGLGPGLVSTAAAALLTDYFLLTPKYSLLITNPFNLLQWFALIALGTASSVSIHVLRLRRVEAEAAQVANLRSLETFRLFIEQSPNAAAMFDNNLKFLAASGRWISEYCGPVTDPVGQHFYDVIPSVPDPWKALHRAALDGRAVRGEALEWIRPGDGARFWLNGAVSPWTDGAGRIGGFIISISDVTEQRRLADELRRARDAAQAADSAKTALLAGMSHELRTPLNGVIGFAEALLGGIFGEFVHPRQREYVEDIHTAGMHLLNLINDILDTSALLARQTTLDETWLDLHQLVATASRFVSTAATKAEVNVTSEVSEGLPGLYGDSRRILQILLNLLSNAIKFTEPGGTVTITAGIEAEGDFAIRIADTGVGMSPEELIRTNAPFTTQADSFVQSRKGAGLGLYLAEGLATIHGGTLAIESVRGIGTTVTVLFPASRVGAIPAEAD